MNPANDTPQELADSERMQNVSAETLDTGTSVAVFTHPQKIITFDVVTYNDGGIELWATTNVDTTEERHAIVASLNPALGADGALAMLFMFQQSAVDLMTDELADKLGFNNKVNQSIILPGTDTR